MKRISIKMIKRSALIVALVVAVITTVHAQYPKATGYVNDFAQVLTREQGFLLNEELAGFEKRTTIEIAVVTVPWLNNEDIEDYTRALAKEWGVGKRGQNNGVVFLIAPKERKMRIETASGTCSILTDGHADQIRNDAIIPRFRSGNIPQGIIDGTHAIMRVLDASATTMIVGKDNTQASAKRERTSDDEDKEKVFRYVIGSIGGVVLALILIIPPLLRSKARKYVMEKKGAIAGRFAEADGTAKSSGVKGETREKLAKLKGKFSLINEMNAATKGVKWFETREKLDSIGYSLGHIVSRMNEEIAFAKEAMEKGPELLKKIPDMIKATEKKLAEGKSSRKATKYLRKARTQYAQVQSQQSEAETMNWAILYLILMDIQSNMENAESAHANTDYSDDDSSESNSSDSNSSYGFGSSGGFGGGGGFTGSGSSGSW